MYSAVATSTFICQFLSDFTLLFLLFYLLFRSVNFSAQTEERIFCCNPDQCHFVLTCPFAGTDLSRSTAGTLQRDCSSLSHSTMSGLKAWVLDPTASLLRNPAMLALIQLQCLLQEASPSQVVLLATFTTSWLKEPFHLKHSSFQAAQIQCVKPQEACSPPCLLLWHLFLLADKSGST